MGLFKSKEEKQIEAKMKVKQTINKFNKQIAKFEEQKKVYLDAAKRAKKLGLGDEVRLAITGYLLTSNQQKRAQKMLLNFEIAAQMKDMEVMNAEFLKSLGDVSKDMIKLTNNKDFAKVQAQFEKAMALSQTRAEQMDMYLESSQTEFAAQTGDASSISDDEIDSLVTELASQDEINESTIDAQLEKIHQKMSQTS